MSQKNSVIDGLACWIFELLKKNNETVYVEIDEVGKPVFKKDSKSGFNIITIYMGKNRAELIYGIKEKVGPVGIKTIIDLMKSDNDRLVLEMLPDSYYTKNAFNWY